jgi:stage V sporulation protein B
MPHEEGLSLVCTQQPMNIASGIGLTAGTRVVAAMISLVVSLVVPRLLGPAQAGAYAYLILIPSFLTLLADLGLTKSMVYHTGRQAFPMESLVAHATVVALALGIAVVLLWTVTLHLLPSLRLESLPIVALVAASTCVPIDIYARFLAFIWLGAGNVIRYNILELTRVITNACLVIGCLLILERNALIAFFGWYLAVVATAGLATLLTWRYRPHRVVLDIDLIKRLLRFGLRGYWADLANFLNHRWDLYVVSWWLGASALGYYALSVNIAERLWIWTLAAAPMTLAYVSATNATTQGPTPAVARATLWLTAASAVGVAIVARWLINFLYGPLFLPSLIPLLLLLPGVVVVSVAAVLADDLNGRGRPELASALSVASLVVSLTAGIILIPNHGINGAAMATSLGYSVQACLALALYQQVVGGDWRDAVMLQRSDLTQLLKRISSLRARERQRPATG